MEYDIDHTNIHKSLFDSQNKSRFELLKICLNNYNCLKMKQWLTYLMEEDLMNHNYKKGDTEGLSTFL